jgi:CelD/BcsL family acetyltransferase involved in cellulose biosynthesis
MHFAIGGDRMSDSSVSERESAPDIIASPSISPFIDEPDERTNRAGAEQALRRPVEQPAAARSRSAEWSGAGSVRVNLSLHGDLDAIEQEWRTFEPRAACTVFQLFDWLAKWQRHVGSRRGTIPAIVCGRDDDARLLFILPLAIEMRGPVRCLVWLGSELCDYNAPVLCERFACQIGAGAFARLWRDVIRLLRTNPRCRFDLIDLEKMPETIGRHRNPLLDLPVLANPSGAHIATLAGDWDRFYAAKRSASTRKRERGKLKQLGQHGEVRFVHVQDRADVARTMDTLIFQKERSFARIGVENIFARPGYRELVCDVAADPGMRELVHVGRMDVGATMGATSLGLTFRGCYYLLFSSYEDGDLARFGPGRAHLHELLRHAIDRGFARFDFTIGDEAYKREWSDIELKLYDHLAANTLRGWAVVAMIAAFRKTKRFIKQTPPLWRAFSKARAMAGRLSRRAGR